MKDMLRNKRILLFVPFLAATVSGPSFFLRKPVLLHTHHFMARDYRSCGGYNEQGTGITVLDPFRPLETEQAADAIFHPASQC
jgi:hypothetical protein